MWRRFVAKDPTSADTELLDAYSRTLIQVAETLSASVAAVSVMGRGRDGGRRPAGSGSAVALTADGYLERLPNSEYRLTALGRTEGGRSFHDEFADLIKPAHAECGPGCWCKDPNHAGEPCPSRPAAPPAPAPEPTPEVPHGR